MNSAILLNYEIMLQVPQCEYKYITVYYQYKRPQCTTKVTQNSKFKSIVSQIWIVVTLPVAWKEKSSWKVWI